MGDGYVKSDKIRNIFYADANNLCGHSMSQHLPDETETHDEIEMWHGHPDLYMNELEVILQVIQILVISLELI